jgi:hypothetical protein
MRSRTPDIAVTGTNPRFCAALALVCRYRRARGKKYPKPYGGYPAIAP